MTLADMDEREEDARGVNGGTSAGMVEGARSASARIAVEPLECVDLSAVTANMRDLRDDEAHDQASR